MLVPERTSHFHVVSRTIFTRFAVGGSHLYLGLKLRSCPLPPGGIRFS